MPMGLGMGLGLSVSRSGGGSAAAELFPDPTLSQVTDIVNGWQFSDGFPNFGPKNNTGPGMQADGSFDGSIASLQGALDAAFAAAVTNGHIYSVAITFANVSVSGSFTFAIGAALGTSFTAANGIVTHNVTAGDPSGGTALLISSTTDGAVYDITHISVT